MAGIFDSLLTNAQNAIVPQPIQNDYNYMMMLSQTDPRGFAEQLKVPPVGPQSVFGNVTSMMPIAGMAKQFKAGPDTVEGLVSHLADTGTTLPSRGLMRPSIHVPSLGETFAGDLGGIHPTDLVNQTLQRRGIPSGGYLFGYTPAYEGAPFVGGELAGYLGVPGGAKTVQGLLNRGIKLNVIEDLLRQGQVPMPR